MFDNKSDRPFDSARKEPVDHAMNSAVDHPDDTRADRALYAGLRDLPTPETSADFDVRILAALERRPPWWQTAWLAVRPAIPTAAGALTVMLLLLHLTQQAPVGTTSSGSHVIARAVKLRMPKVDGCSDGPQEPGSDRMGTIDLNSTAISFLNHPMLRISGKCG